MHSRPSEARRWGPLAHLAAGAVSPPSGLDLVAHATGMGVPATTAEELAEQLQKALAEPGPHLIDAVLPRG